MKFAGPFEAANLSSMLEASRIVDSKDGLSLEENIFWHKLQLLQNQLL